MAFGEQVAARYESWYESPKGRRAAALEKALMLWLLGRYPHAESILEVGCGTGHFTRWWSAQGLAAIGMDRSPAMLTVAQSLNGPPLVCGDARSLPFGDSAFDLTVLVTTLEFLERPRQGLAEALRVARHGVLLGVLNRWSTLGLQRRLAGLLRQTVYDTAHLYGVGELQRLLRSVAGDKMHIVWRTTLFPRCLPDRHAHLPWGAFIGIALIVDDLPQEAGRRADKRYG
jgi:ubiquinone/menaquinone biosynthesis C-methylase UbiE